MGKQKLLIVGAFPPADSLIVGGIVTICRTLMDSDFPSYFDLFLIDSTQKTNPPPRFVIRSLFAMVRYFRYLRALVFEKPDSVLLFTSVGASVVEKGTMAWLARLRKCPVFLFPRGAELIDDYRNKPWQRIWIFLMMKGATHFLCQGPSWQEFAINDLGYNEKRAPIIYNWTATPELLRIGTDRKLCAEKSDINILFLGWLEAEKGIFELLEVCKKLIPQHSFLLTIAGKGNAEEMVSQFVAQSQMSTFVKLEGWAQHEKKTNLLKSADILVLPSWSEGFPNAIIEAMAAKVAVIVSAVGNVPSMLEHRKQAMIVPPKDINALSSAIEELLLNSHLRTEIAEQGYNFARDNFSTRKTVQRLAGAIISAVENYGANR